MSNPNPQTVRWYKSLSFQGLAGLALITLWLFTGIIFVMNTRGKKLLSNQSSRLIEVTGNNAVSRLNARSLEVAALARTLATIAENLPKSPALFKKEVPKILDFQGDLAIAGGGIWFEPYAFRPDRQRVSFFWGRDKNGKLKYYDDYNQPGLGYHHEEWYVPARYTKPNTCFWSKSYIDPYSNQPMVTCTVSMFEKDKFFGVATVDLRIEGLQSFADYLRQETGGYVFLLDRNNKFITFPQPSLVRQNSKQNREFLLAAEFARKSPLFLPLAKATNQMNREAVIQAREMANYNSLVAKTIDRDSYQIDRAEAELIAAAIANPLKPNQSQSSLYMKVDLSNDFLFKQAGTAFIFHIPTSYWKLVIVKPNSEINAVSFNIIKLLIIYVSITIAIIMLVAYFLFNRFLINPLSRTTKAVERMGLSIANKQFNSIEQLPISKSNFNEISLLSQVFNTLTTEVVEQHNQLEEINVELEQKVDERTIQLARANTEIVILNDRLKAENIRLSAEVEIARQLQQNILPKQQELNRIEGLEIAAFMQPADEVGGDYYDILSSNGRVKIGIGDVTGHGLESGIFTLVVQTAVRTLFASDRGDPVEFLNVVNKTVYDNTQRMNIDKNMSLSLLDYAGGKVSLSGQHEEIIVIRNDGKLQRIDTIDLGFPIGLEPDIAKFIGQKDIVLSSGDMVLLYTDGITEAENKSGVQYGLEKLCEVAIINWQASAEEIKQAIIDDVRSHIGSAKVYDDITLLVLKQK